MIALLESWQAGNVSTQEVLSWASKRFIPGEVEFDDWENDCSATNEVLAELDSLDMNLVLPEDAPIHISFLKTPPGQFEEGFAKWQEAVGSIDFKARIKQLKDHPIYGPFCK